MDKGSTVGIIKEELLKEYYSAIDTAFAKFTLGKLNDALAYYKYASTIAWKYPILEKFVDDKLEQSLGNISISIRDYSKVNVKKCYNKKVVLYSGQLVDRGGLTEQYLYTLAHAGYEVLLIVPESGNTLSGKKILEFSQLNDFVELFIPKSTNLVDKINEISERVFDFNPEKIFLHFLPNDVVGFCAFFQYPQLKFLIVHNDHTFWLGKNCSDYYIEFRDFGISLSINRRGIEMNQILHIPYYPIINETETFEGFPFNKEKYIIGVGGANLYKYYIDNELKYFHIIKELIEENNNFIFCLCGWGDETIVEKFINENNLHGRFYFLGKRNDFSSVVANSDILFESYPLKGGLVMLYGNYHSKPIAGISDFQSSSGSIEDFLSIEGYNQPTSLEDFKAEANKLIKSQDYRIHLASILGNNKFNKSDFTNSILKVLQNDIEDLIPTKVKPLRINDNLYLRKYLKNSAELNRISGWDKLISLRSAFTFNERIRTIKKILVNTKTNRIKTFIRIMLLLTIGRQKL